MMIASPAGHGRTSRGAVNGIFAQRHSPAVPAIRYCVAVALVSLAMLVPARARAQECADSGDRQVRSLSFVGNKTFSSDALSAIVVTTPSSFAKRHFRIFGTARCYPPNGVGADTATIERYYQYNGFYDTHVDTVVKTVGRGVVDVTFRINEGQPLLLDTLEISGLDSVPNRAAVTKDLQLKVGERAGRLQMYSDVASIVSRLHNAGYPNATVFPQFDTHRDEHRADVHLEVVTGVRSRFGTIRVASTSQSGGTPEIDTAVVRRLLGFASGDRYSDDALTNAQRNLYNLGAFKHVDVAIDSASRTDSSGAPRPARDSLADTLTNVEITLREDFLRQLEPEEGWATLDCFRASVQYTDKNFLHAARRLDLTARLSKIGYAAPLETSATRNLCYRPYLDQDSIASSKVNYYLAASLRQPTLFGTHWVPAYTAYTERRGEYKAYLRTTYIGGDVSATRYIGQGMPFRLGYTLEYGKTEAQPATLCAQFFRCSVTEQQELERNLRLAVASASLQRIRVDDPVEPTHGYIVGGELRGASRYIGSDASQQFEKGTAEISAYKAITKRIVVAGRLSGGVITAPRDTTGARQPPPQERLYAGGPNSVRGFQQNLLGPVVYLVDASKFTITTTDSNSAMKTSAYVLKEANSSATRTIPVGGNAVFVFNAEMRIRDPFFPELIQYVPFVDGGQVWSRLPNVNNFRLLNSILVTPGLGIRISSPVGPIQLSLGYNSHPSQPGPVYFGAPVDQAGRAPLICVTRPGDSTVPVTIGVDGSVVQAKCPATFAPASPSGFFQRLTKIFSIGTSF